MKAQSKYLILTSIIVVLISFVMTLRHWHSDTEIWIAEAIESEWGTASSEIRLNSDGVFIAHVRFSNGTITQTGVYRRDEHNGRLTLYYEHGKEPVSFEFVSGKLIRQEEGGKTVVLRKEK